MATSPLFGWEEPDDTDLVKDGAAAIRTLGNAIDTSMGDLLGGTTGQVLSKNSNTNMDFTWVTSDDANAIQNTIVDAKGDLISATGSDVPARLAVGANNLVLTADSSTATGLKYTGDWISYTPVWGVVSGTAPTIGNGNLVGAYRRIGSVVDFYINMTAQSTTTFGSGSYTWSLPVAISVAEFNFGCQAAILDSGVTWYQNYRGSGVPYAYTDKFVVVNPTATTEVSNLSPMTWTAGDGIRIFGSYRVVA
jgi:hypothetical protein